jgi:hypothetical protein
MIQVKKLTSIQGSALQMRFTENRTIFDISKRLGLTWEQADLAIEEALRTLRLFTFRGMA